MNKSVDKLKKNEDEIDFESYFTKAHVKTHFTSFA